MTSIEKLVYNLVYNNLVDNSPNSKLWEIVEQAKEIHRKEIIDAVNLPREKRWYNAKLYNSSGEQYYQETYKKD